MRREGLLILIGITFCVLSIIIALIGFETEVVGEKLCVDGNGDKNLEGMMCEETRETFFGESSYYGFLLILPALLVLIILITKIL